ncbi:hypothetical protein BCR35DRAFT_300418 [Leucosporidium creatinivorum]|uniref:Peptidase family-domain-containing protein n=1 Tax=Leucosporidium creatinivorum TaxID=106004 RepID=A0A1Y2FYV9_9BASI|nr:hypothetical protein BCR35DRAFT_300418 [Leucosporidium creatinivorum]
MATLVLAQIARGSTTQTPLPTDHPLYEVVNSTTALPRQGSESLKALAEACLPQPFNDYHEEQEFRELLASTESALLKIFSSRRKSFIILFDHNAPGNTFGSCTACTTSIVNQYIVSINGALLQAFHNAQTASLKHPRAAPTAPKCIASTAEQLKAAVVFLIKGTIFHELAHIIGASHTLQLTPPRIRSVAPFPGADDHNGERGAYAEERLMGGVFGAVLLKGKGLESVRGVFIRVGVQVQTAERGVGRSSEGKPYARAPPDEKSCGAVIDEEHLIDPDSLSNLNLSFHLLNPQLVEGHFLPDTFNKTHAQYYEARRCAINAYIWTEGGGEGVAAAGEGGKVKDDNIGGYRRSASWDKSAEVVGVGVEEGEEEVGRELPSLPRTEHDLGAEGDFAAVRGTCHVDRS